MKDRITSTYLKWIASAAIISMVACGAQTNPVEGIQSASTNDTSNNPSTEFNPDIFTIEGKYTKTIETPWGPKQVYDPAQDPEVREYFKIRREKGKAFKASDSSIEYLRASTAQRHLVSLDYARHQCVKQSILQGCFETDFVFKNECPLGESLHSTELSKCEWKNLVQLRQFLTKCTHSEYQNIYESVMSAPTLDETLEQWFETDCQIWRGQAGGDYWKSVILRDDDASPYR